VAIEVAVLDHAAVGVVVRRDYTVSIKVAVIELSCIDLVVMTWEEIFAETCHLAVDPLSFVPFIGSYEVLSAHASLLVVLELTLVDISGAILDFTHAMHLAVKPVPKNDVAATCYELSIAVLFAVVSKLSFEDAAILLVEDLGVFALLLLELVKVEVMNV